jgi:PAS domain S-box-containing protein
MRTRKQTRDTLFEDGASFRFFFERSADPALLLEGDVIIDCNDSALRAFHCHAKSALVGHHPWDCSPGHQPDGNPSSVKAREVIDATLSQGTNRFEWVHTTFDSQELWVDVSAIAIPLRHRPIIYTVFQDVSKRKQAEQALKRAEEKYRDIFENAVLGILQATPDGRFLSANRAIARMYGYDSPEELMEAVTDIGAELYVDPEARKRFSETLEQKGSIEGYETERYRKDGSKICVSANARIVRDGQGKVLYYEGTQQDITKHKLAEEALKESEERYRIAIEHSNDGVAIVRKNQHVFVNQRFLTMFGYEDPSEVLGRSLLATIHPDDYERVIEINLENKKEGAVSLRYEFKGVRRDGTVINVEVSSTRIVYQGKPAILAYIRDISERVRAEEMLRQSQKMEAVGTLSAGIAHDFNNILTAILGFASLSYEDAGAGGKIKRYLMHVLNAAQRGKDLVTQILSFSRKGKEGLKPTNLASVVKESVKMLRATLPKIIAIRTDITSESSIVLADGTQIQQIIMNLGTNSAYAMREKGGSMTVELSCLTLTPEIAPSTDLTIGRYLRLSITDTGTGMDKDVLDRVFDPFFTTKDPGQGTGLGLWVVHSIVKNHKGAITARSTPGEGTTFELLLPQIQKRPLRKKGHFQGTEGSGHILVVDDEAELLQLERIMLERLGYTTTGVDDSHMALDIFKEKPEKYDVVLIDQVMPGMSGIDLARQFISVRPDVPVVLITGYVGDLDEVTMRKAGVKVIVTKPMTSVDLGLAIKQARAEDRR